MSGKYDHILEGRSPEERARMQRNIARLERRQARVARVLDVSETDPGPDFRNATVGDMLARIFCPVEATEHVLTEGLQTLAKEIYFVRIAAESTKGDDGVQPDEIADVLRGIEQRLRVLGEIAARFDDDDDGEHDEAEGDGGEEDDAGEAVEHEESAEGISALRRAARHFPWPGPISLTDEVMAVARAEAATEHGRERDEGTWEMRLRELLAERSAVTAAAVAPAN